MTPSRSFWSAALWPVVCVSIYLFMYVPIIILVLFSFNYSATPFEWQGFSLRWYHELWHSDAIWAALKNSLIVAMSTVVTSLTLGTLFVLYSSKSYVSNLVVFFYASLAMPEIVLAVGLLNLFVILGVPLGLTTLIAGHTLIGLGYVVPIIKSRFDEFDKRYMEASMDLGATQGQTFRKVYIPLLGPALAAASLLVFIVSLDDFIISFFCSGAATQTLPIYIFALIRSGATPVINALSTVLLVISSTLVLIFSSLKIKKMDLLQ
ncbi:putrescine/spermidine ABC transporter permease [Candidatus Dependentiae bacterium Noda2021]|nr:putrescine/spermidine ABC transporter permease [Candidatus Dependentiae bacterium Noda2021]